MKAFLRQLCNKDPKLLYTTVAGGTQLRSDRGDIFVSTIFFLCPILKTIPYIFQILTLVGLCIPVADVVYSSALRWRTGENAAFLKSRTGVSVASFTFVNLI